MKNGATNLLLFFEIFWDFFQIYLQKFYFQNIPNLNKYKPWLHHQKKKVLQFDFDFFLGFLRSICKNSIFGTILIWTTVKCACTIQKWCYNFILIFQDFFRFFQIYLQKFHFWNIPNLDNYKTCLQHPKMVLQFYFDFLGFFQIFLDLITKIPFLEYS